MHFCQSQLASFLLQDNSCILESDLDPSSSSRLSAAWQKAALLRTTKADAIGASAIVKQNWSKCNRGEADGLQERGDCLHPFILLENLCPLKPSLLKSVCLLCNRCHPLFLNLWPPFVALFDFKPTLLSLICSPPLLSFFSLCPVSLWQAEQGRFVCCPIGPSNLFDSLNSVWSPLCCFFPSTTDNFRNSQLFLLDGSDVPISFL